jgi:hypothetical protein
MKIYPILGWVCLGMAFHVGAKNRGPVDFSQGKWQIVCSNTGTCKVMGYGDANDAKDRTEAVGSAALLFTRQAGANQTVKAKWIVTNDEGAQKSKPIYLYAHNHNLGQVRITDTSIAWGGDLTDQQTQALLAKATQSGEILFKSDDEIWVVSDKGMAAVLLKMDEFQQRVGTTGALISKGKQDESQVLAAAPKLTIKKVSFSDKPYLILQPNTAAHAHLKQRLLARLSPVQECEGVIETGSTTGSWQEIVLYRLNNDQSLAMTTCWRGAYNIGYGAWVVDKSLQGKVTFVSDQINEVGKGKISGVQKVSGGSDCWYGEEWVWNGQQFIQSQNRSTGPCTSISAGGVWQMDSIEANVK